MKSALADRQTKHYLMVWQSSRRKGNVMAQGSARYKARLTAFLNRAGKLTSYQILLMICKDCKEGRATQIETLDRLNWLFTDDHLLDWQDDPQSVQQLIDNVTKGE